MLKSLCLAALLSLPGLASAAGVPAFEGNALQAGYDAGFDLLWIEGDVTLADGRAADIIVFGGIDDLGSTGAVLDLYVGGALPDLTVALVGVRAGTDRLWLDFENDAGLWQVELIPGTGNPLDGFDTASARLTAAPSPAPLPRPALLIIAPLAALAAFRRTV